MNKIKNYLILITIILFIFFLFKYNNILTSTIIYSVNIWLNNIFPFLFIMMIINDILINSNIINLLTSKISNIFNRVFSTSGNSCNAFLLSIISGTPTNAYIIKELYNNKSITLNDANKLLTFTYFSNPLFLYNILLLSFNKYTTIKIILSHYLSNIFIGIFFFRNKDNNNYKINNNINLDIITILPKAISKSINTLLMILGSITFYLIITNLLVKIINLNIYIEVLLKGLLEITSSLKIINNLNNSIIKEIIALSIISFSGLSIHTQVASILNDTDIKYKYFFIGRILHIIISIIIYVIIP